LAVGKEMATIGKTISSNTVRHIKKISAAAFAVFLASLAVYALGYKFILLNYAHSKPNLHREMPKGKVEWR
jgi:hypothetical protein